MTSKKLVSRSGYVALESINFGFKPIYTSLLSLYIIRFCAINLWGQMVFYLISVQLLLVLVSWGQKPYLMKLFSASPHKIGFLWGKAFISRAPLLALSVLFVFFIPELRIYFFPLIIWIATKWFTFMCEPVVQFTRSYKQSIAAELIAIIITGVFLIIWRGEIDINRIIWLFAIAHLSKVIVLIPILIRNKVYLPKPQGMYANLVVSFPFFALTLAGMFQTKSDLLLATFLMDPNDLAFYQVLVGFLLLGQAFAGISLGPFVKNIFRLKEENVNVFKHSYLKVGTLASILIALAINMIMRYIYLFDYSWELTVLTFFYLAPLYFFMIESQLLLKYEKVKLLFQLTSLAAFVNLILSYFLIPLFGITGALIGGIGSKVLLAKLILRYHKKVVSIK